MMRHLRDTVRQLKMKNTSTVLKTVKTSDLIPYANNSRLHSEDQVLQIASSIKEFGFLNPIIIDGENGIVAGHGRVMAAKKLGINELPCIEAKHLTEAQKKAYVIADNKIALNSEWDIDSLRVEFEALREMNFDVELTGFSLDEIGEFMIEEIAPEYEEYADGEVSEPPVDPITKEGDVWILGKHRLMCGSSTDTTAVEKLMNGGKADIVFTSPPYNVGKTPNGNENKYIGYHDNQSNQDYLDLLVDFTNNGLMFADYVFCNVQSVSGNKLALIDYLYKMKEVFADTMIWDKQTAEPAMARRVMNSRFEYIYIFSKEANRAIGKKDFRGTVPNIFSLNSRAGKEFAKIHKATFRVELPEYFIDTFCESSIIDLFGGTGTTMIAAEKKNVKSYLMELDPRYCDVIIKRWESLTNKKAVLESTGEEFNEH